MSFEWTEVTRRGPRRPSEPGHQAERAPVSAAIARSSDELLARQAPEGFWCGELTADTTLESDYILLQLWLHQPVGAVWDPPSKTRIQKACRSILQRQLPNGGFSIYHGGPA